MGDSSIALLKPEEPRVQVRTTSGDGVRQCSFQEGLSCVQSHTYLLPRAFWRKLLRSRGPRTATLNPAGPSSLSTRRTFSSSSRRILAWRLMTSPDSRTVRTQCIWSSTTKAIARSTSCRLRRRTCSNSRYARLKVDPHLRGASKHAEPRLSCHSGSTAVCHSSRVRRPAHVQAANL